MNIRQKQWQLYFLGYYDGKIDGIWGDKSRTGTKQFQADNHLWCDGVFGFATESKSTEIIKKIQKAVGATVDGLAGENTKAATVEYQKKHGLTADGIAGEKTLAKINEGSSNATASKPASGTFWDEIEFFTREEFRCQCKGKYCNGFPVEPEEKMVRTLDEIRRRLGVPISIVDAGGSGVRCKQHNANVGGVSNSQHLYGLAADLHSSASPARMKAVAEEVMGNTGGIGLYSWGIHIDTRKTKSRWNG